MIFWVHHNVCWFCSEMNFHIYLALKQSGLIFSFINYTMISILKSYFVSHSPPYLLNWTKKTPNLWKHKCAKVLVIKQISAIKFQAANKKSIQRIKLRNGIESNCWYIYRFIYDINITAVIMSRKNLINNIMRLYSRCPRLYAHV